ncbi:MAG: hypothetical protein CME45_02455 [Halieaceae bacterium]|nr:hypothetical protein [Halieaceae bacterium]
MRAAVASSPIHIEVELKLLLWGQRDYTLGPVWSARLGGNSMPHGSLGARSRLECQAQGDRV